MIQFNSIIGQSPAFESLLRNAKVVAATDVTVLIKGETGTGKEVLATAIQQASARADKAFVVLNCAALPEGIIESELFGHKKGAFTGATANKQGIFQTADGGTLFLDEINSLSLGMQAKLLRFLETGECFAVGDVKPYTVNTRIIAATNADLNQKIERGEFRQDLFFRLNVVPLDLPTLKERKEDLRALVNHFLKHFSEIHTLRLSKFSKPALKKLELYQWPGNIRELRNLCERLSILLAGQTIEPENLPYEFTRHAKPSIGESFTLPSVGFKLEILEADLINQALTRTNGNRSKSARLLGISRDKLLYRIQKHGLMNY
ncbi:MAG: sigma-54-dependent Fis family transcriptional regulator [Methylococcales bacterium]|nr:sigma-54-dependent Fis family transcriptional regulator [Methylococcales bacterium]